MSSKGCFIVDSDGRRYFDGSGGAAISSLGHSNARVVTAVQDQVTKLAFAHTSFFTSEPAEELANLLIKNAPGTFVNLYARDASEAKKIESLKTGNFIFVKGKVTGVFIRSIEIDLARIVK